MYDPRGTDTGQTDWIELYNKGTENIILSKYGFGLNDDSVLELDTSREHYLHCHELKESIIISPNKYIVLANNDVYFHDVYNFPFGVDVYDTVLDLNSKGDYIRLSRNNCRDFFLEVSYEKSFGGSNNEKTIEKKELTNKYTSSDWQESYILGGTPGKENSKKPEEEEEEEEKKDEKDYAGKLKINEILPAPKTQNDGKEFVEIINISTETISLSGMRIEDEKNHKVTFPEKTIAPLELFILEGNFELNNTSPDSAYLIAKDGTKENPIDSISYEKPKYDYAYAYDGTAWQWTSKITRGAKNEFDELLTGEIKKDKTIYAGIYANFEAKTNGKAKKFTWDFGDGHKSYLKKTRHKYAETGTYSASLKITGDGKENLINFTVEVEKFGKAKVRIVGLSANPKGSDSDNEWLEIWNGTKKKIDLKGWSVATGWKNLYNHPITKKFILKAGETKKLTREFCAFALGNKQAKIELRYPDGKVADKIKYNRKDNSISEDELYQKTTAGWDWTTPEKEPTPTNEESEKPVAPISETLPEEKPEEINVDIDLSLLGKYSENPAWQQKQEKQLVFIFAGSNISPARLLAQNQGRVLGISTENHFQITHNQEKTTLSPFSFDFIWKKINARLNWIINSV